MQKFLVLFSKKNCLLNFGLCLENAAHRQSGQASLLSLVDGVVGFRSATIGLPEIGGSTGSLGVTAGVGVGVRGM